LSSHVDRGKWPSSTYNGTQWFGFSKVLWCTK